MSLQIIPFQSGLNNCYILKDKGAVLIDGAWTGKANVAQIMITDDPSWDPVEGMSLLGKMPPVSK